ncbi:MAG: amidohydrolase [Chloroflexota bacterium]|nr:MAG: amidohydrolase [Chloroflexota bacterium]
MSNLVLKNGNIYTSDERNLRVQAMAISQGKIAFVGLNEGVDRFIHPGSEVIDLEGKMVLPAFVDAHAHPSQAMDLFANINLYLQDSPETYLQIIQNYILEYPDKQQYRGSGWDNSLFPDHGPDKNSLDAILAEKPIALVSYDAHSLWVNSITLERAQITRDTPNPEGGVIEKDPVSGEPIGTLRESAMKLVAGVFPDYSLEERVNTLLTYQRTALRYGISLCHDAMLDEKSIAGFKALEQEGKLHMRFRGSILVEPDSSTKDQIVRLIDQRAMNTRPRFQTNAAKLFVDGVVEGGTAYLLEPYQDRSEYYGELIWHPQQLKEICAALDKEKFQIHLHVIGDAAARIALDALEFAQQQNGKRDARHLITHLQLVAEEDIHRFHQLGVIGIPNPYWFRIDDYYWKIALPFLGKERADRQYPLRSFFDTGVRMASASDFPVTVDFNPLIGIEMGHTRAKVGSQGSEILWAEERLALKDMISSFTINGAYANFLENQMGTLAVGKSADFIVLNQDLFSIPANKIAEVKVLETFIEGQSVFSYLD